jgi:hypothetical protein
MGKTQNGHPRGGHKPDKKSGKNPLKREHIAKNRWKRENAIDKRPSL